MVITSHRSSKGTFGANNHDAPMIIARTRRRIKGKKLCKYISANFSEQSCILGIFTLIVCVSKVIVISVAFVRIFFLNLRHIYFIMHIHSKRNMNVKVFCNIICCLNIFSFAVHGGHVFTVGVVTRTICNNQFLLSFFAFFTLFPCIKPLFSQPIFSPGSNFSFCFGTVKIKIYRYYVVYIIVSILI